MEIFLEEVTRYVVLVIQALAVVVVAIGVVQTMFAAVRALARTPTQVEQRQIWLSFARWLVAGLTLQLASDIVQTTVAPTWDDIGRLASIAATRTFLSYFLDRDMDVIRDRQQQATR